jgi:hypothetical protein
VVRYVRIKASACPTALSLLVVFKNRNFDRRLCTGSGFGRAQTALGLLASANL